MFQPFLPPCSCLHGIRDLPHAAGLGDKKPCSGMIPVLPAPCPHPVPCKQGQTQGEITSSLYQFLQVPPFPTKHHDMFCVHGGHYMGISRSPRVWLVGCRSLAGSPVAAVLHCTGGWLWGSSAAPRTAHRQEQQCQSLGMTEGT